MATITIRNLDDRLKSRLRVRAASHNRSMEEEARQILRSALQGTPPAQEDLATRIRARFVGLGDVQLPLQPREPVRDLGLWGVGDEDEPPSVPAKGRKTTGRR